MYDKRYASMARILPGSFDFIFGKNKVLDLDHIFLVRFQHIGHVINVTNIRGRKLESPTGQDVNQTVE